MRPLTDVEQQEYEKLTSDAEQIQLKIDELLNKPVTYGYARVSSRGQAKDGNSLEAQEQALKSAGCDIIVHDIYTGMTIERPELDKLIKRLKRGDMLVVTKLDRLARSVQQGIKLLDDLAEQGVRINVLNVGIMDNSPTGQLFRTVMLAFAEFERNMLMQRTREGKEQARLNPEYHEGRKRLYTDAQLSHAMDLLRSNSYTQVTRMTGISKSTLIREKKRRKGLGLWID